ncbi:DUF397 domain-containing protein [Streptomyces fimicarius]|uniref:DUF397 domain-containing protein n=1 Tax=Streptomyces TaxID=1883 RepID=UPI0004AAFD57|nr:MULTISPECIES: DUF397 domain-containing protein [Streptomyces]MDX2674760.1 DUF397 domain-containing protein [Streptomyces sp. NRRL_ISP-5395]GHF72224.1 hypothetical protein GCM10010504_45880 [Streptomyces griseus]
MEHGPDLTNADWRKSSYSGNTGGECVEIAEGFHGSVPVRDSKNPTGPAILLGAPAWQAFVDGLR